MEVPLTVRGWNRRSNSHHTGPHYVLYAELRYEYGFHYTRCTHGLLISPALYSIPVTRTIYPQYREPSTTTVHENQQPSTKCTYLMLERGHPGSYPEKQAIRETNRHIDRRAGKQAGKQRGRQAGRQIDRKAGGQTGRRTDR